MRCLEASRSGAPAPIAAARSGVPVPVTAPRTGVPASVAASLGGAPTTTAALLLAVDPVGLGGAVLHGRDPAAAEAWTRAFVALLPAGAPLRRVPSSITADRLVGGLDLSATLASGRVVAERGVLAAADGGVLTLDAARTRAGTWPHVARALDTRVVTVQRDGVEAHHAASFALVAVEGGDDEHVPAAIADRVAFLVDLDEPGDHQASPNDAGAGARAVALARLRLRAVRDDGAAEAIVRGADTLGVRSTRVLLAALAAARASAALGGRDEVAAIDVATAARLVLAPRTTEQPPAADESHETADAPHADDVRDPASRVESPNTTATTTTDAPESQPDPAPESRPEGEVAAMADVVVRAARAAIPTGLLAASAAVAARASAAAGRAGAAGTPGTRGRQVGVRRGDPRTGARLDVVATLRAAAPLQRVRRDARETHDASARPRVSIRKEDFRVRTCVTHAMTTTVFVVDASGSSALHRLAEAKGAVELLLAEGYARRERVALIAFRGTSAELVLPPTHALARARRVLAALPAGGGTPLAAALDLAGLVVAGAKRDASQVITVLLTDGRANVARDGRGGRPRAEADALDAARRLGALGCASVLVDTGPRPEPFARRVAHDMGARYVPLPMAGAHDVGAAARALRG